MKKTITIGILLFSLITLIIGCKSNEKNNYYKDEKSINDSHEEKKLSDYKQGHKIKCSLLNENIISYLDNFVEYNSKEIYHINFNQLYSNNENCIKVFTANNNIIGTINHGYYSGMADINGHIYGINESNLQIFEDIGKHLAYLPKDDELMSSLPGTFIHSVYNKKNKTLIIYENYKVNNEKKYIVDISKLKDEEVIMNYGDVIKTNKKYYQIVKNITNKEECNKYADIECEYKYEIINNEIMSNSYNDILSYINGKIIMKDLNVIDIHKISKE